jgi:hypothetical protein
MLDLGRIAAHEAYELTFWAIIKRFSNKQGQYTSVVSL